MKRIAICCLVLVCYAAAYQVHEEPEEDDETVRGKRQQSGTAVIDSIFNIPITAIKQTSVAAQTLSPENAGTIDTVLKIPVTTLEAVSKLIKNRYRETTPYTPTRPPRRLQDVTTTTSTTDASHRRRDEIRRHFEIQREQQRRYQEELHRRRMQQIQNYNRRMQQQIADEDERTQHRFFRDPFGFNAIAKWVVTPQRVFNGHAGHGDGHVYQYFDQQKPLHFGGHSNQQHQGISSPIPTKPTTPLTISTTSSSSAISSTSPSVPSHTYAVHEIVDEGLNPFVWPNWFGILNVLRTEDRIQNKIAPKKTKVKFDEPLLENKIAPKDERDYKIKYVETRKKLNPISQEITGNEIDGDVTSSEARNDKSGKVVFPQ